MGRFTPIGLPHWDPLFWTRLTFFFSTGLAYFFRLKFQNFDSCLKSWHFLSIFFFSFVNIYFANLDSYFLLHLVYFTSSDLCIMFSTCFYHRYNFVPNGTTFTSCQNIACSRRSDSGERCEVKRSAKKEKRGKRRGERGNAC